MPRLGIRAIAFDMYGTVVDVGVVAEACKEVASDPIAFSAQWRAKQLEYSFLRTLMGRYQDFWKVSEQALDFSIRRYGLTVSPDQRRRLMDAWLRPTPYPEVAAALPRLKQRYPLAILSNGSPRMLRTGLKQTDLGGHFRWVISADEVKLYKPSPIPVGPRRRSRILRASLKHVVPSRDSAPRHPRNSPHAVQMAGACVAAHLFDARTWLLLVASELLPKDSGRGTGLGPPDSQDIVERRGGTIRVETDPGAGMRSRKWLSLNSPSLPQDPHVAPAGTKR